MLVDQAFTLEAGRTIWGFPKVMADFTIRDGHQFGFDVSIDGQLVAGMEFRRGLSQFRRPSLRASRSCARTRISTVRRCETPMRCRCRGARYRPGGVRLRLGDHPTRKNSHRLASRSARWSPASADNVEMSFGDAQEVSTSDDDKPDVDLTDGAFYADVPRPGSLPLDAGQRAGVPRPQRVGRRDDV